MTTSEFLTPMLPWPGMAGFARSARLPGGQLHFFDSEVGGNNLPCVLVHGLGDEADTWRGVFPALAAQRRVIAPDLPGFGRSDLPSRPVNIQSHIQALLDLLEHLSLPLVLWVGHSMGAVLSQQLALEYPARTAGLVLLSGGLAAGKTRLNPTLVLFLIPGLGELAYSYLRRDPQTAYRTLYPYYHDLDGLPQAEREWLYLRVNQRVWSDTQRRAYLSSLRSLASWLPGQQRGLAARLAQSKTPTTIVWGEDDRVVDPTNGKILERLLPPGMPHSLQLVPGAGHNLHQEKPAAIVTAVDHLASLV